MKRIAKIAFAALRMVAHYALLILVAYSGTLYWYLTAGDSFSAKRIGDGLIGMDESAAGFLGFILDPAFSYAVLAMCVLLVIKEFFVGSLKTRFMLNAAGFAVVCLFIGFFQYWVFHRT